MDEKLGVMLSTKLRSYFPQPVLEQNFVPFEGKQIKLPGKLAEPDAEFIRYHRKVVFKN